MQTCILLPDAPSVNQFNIAMRTNLEEPCIVYDFLDELEVVSIDQLDELASMGYVIGVFQDNPSYLGYLIRGGCQ